MVSIDGPAIELPPGASLEDALRRVLLSREAISLYELAQRLEAEAGLLKAVLDEWIVNEKVECLFPARGRDNSGPAREDARAFLFYRWKRERDASQLWQLKYSRKRSRAALPRSTDHRAFLY